MDYIQLPTPKDRTAAMPTFDVGCWMLDVGCWVLDVGCWVLDVGCWVLDVGCSPCSMAAMAPMRMQSISLDRTASRGLQTLQTRAPRCRPNPPTTSGCTCRATGAI